MRKFTVITIGMMLFLACSCSDKPVTPETALQSWLDRNDGAFRWETDTITKSQGISFTRIIMTSQVWRGIEWKHEMTLLIPENVNQDEALLFITGGSVKNGQPNIHGFDEDLTQALARVAVMNKTLVAILWQVPNQPLYDDLTEDALISYTLHNYLNDGDLTWPLLFPMTKSAVRAMDAIQQFAQKEIDHRITSFIVSGASKRGWTTWLTGANDKRVKAICPMVIDVLNMPVNIDYQKAVWGDYSVEIQDYVKLGIAQQLGTPGGNDLVKMIDPYSYRKTLAMPKMIFMGTNDPYWPVDAVKNYIDSIPGDNNICYTPNAGHDLGGGRVAMMTLSAFLGLIANDMQIPPCDYQIVQNEGDISLKVFSDPAQLQKAILWSSVSEDQDFRDETWADSVLQVPKDNINVKIAIPASGYRAFYVDLLYKAPSGEDYTQSTRMFVADSLKLLLK